MTSLKDGSEGKLCVSIVTPFFFVLFAIVMAVVSAVHSFLIVAYAGRDKVAKEVGFYYMANAGGRLVGTMLSGVVYQYTANTWGISICLWSATGFLLISSIVSCFLPPIVTDGGQPEKSDGGHPIEIKNLELSVRECKEVVTNGGGKLEGLDSPRK